MIFTLNVVTVVVVCMLFVFPYYSCSSCEAAFGDHRNLVLCVCFCGCEIWNG